MIENKYSAGEAVQLSTRSCPNPQLLPFSCLIFHNIGIRYAVTSAWTWRSPPHSSPANSSIAVSPRLLARAFGQSSQVSEPSTINHQPSGPSTVQSISSHFKANQSFSKQKINPLYPMTAKVTALEPSTLDPRTPRLNQG